jgi:hypothetical protein
LFENCFPDESFNNCGSVILDLCGVPTSKAGLEAMYRSRLIVSHTEEMSRAISEVSGKPTLTLKHAALVKKPKMNLSGQHTAHLNFWPHPHPPELDFGPIHHSVSDTLSGTIMKTLLPTHSLTESLDSLSTLLSNSTVKGDPVLVEQLMRDPVDDYYASERKLLECLNG